MYRASVKAARKPNLIAAAWLAALATASADAWAQKSEEEIALAAQNPVAAMVSVPFQYNYDQNIGPQESGHKHYVNVQPVIPFSLNEDWNLISRTIMPLVWEQDIFPGAGSQSGVGDITQSLFFSPKLPTAGGVIWGVGPVFLLPVASDDLLGGEQRHVGVAAPVHSHPSRHPAAAASGRDRSGAATPRRPPGLSRGLRRCWAPRSAGGGATRAARHGDGSSASRD